MMWKLVIFFIFSVCGATSTFPNVFHEINNTTYICNPVANSTNDDYLMLGDGHDSCECKETHCTCCEYDVEKVCISVGYIEVFDIPAKFALNVTYNDKLIVDLLVDVTNVPCIKIPFTKNFMDLCIQLYDIEVLDNYVSLCIQLRGHAFFTRFGIPLGCVKIPRLTTRAQEHLTGNFSIDANSSATNNLMSYYIITYAFLYYYFRL